MSRDTPERGPEGELPGQRLRRIVFQNPQTGGGNAGLQTFGREVRQPVFMYVEAYRVRFHPVLEYSA
jgi:hypothetical protein